MWKAVVACACACILCGLLLAGCAAPPAAPAGEEEIQDPAPDRHSPMLERLRESNRAAEREDRAADLERMRAEMRDLDGRIAKGQAAGEDISGLRAQRANLERTIQTEESFLIRTAPPPTSQQQQK